MLLALLLQTAAPQTAVEAERAFNAMAQAEGQWTAFRAFAAPDAIMFNPQPVKTHELLRDKSDPKIAVQWWPAESFVSCDGTVAVNTGPWVLPKAGGYFTTVWERQQDGAFKWSYDGGDALAKPRALPERVRVRRAACAGLAGPAPTTVPCPPQPFFCPQTIGFSNDVTLIWDWEIKDKVRTFRARLWNGKGYETVIENVVNG